MVSGIGAGGTLSHGKWEGRSFVVGIIGGDLETAMAFVLCLCANTRRGLAVG